ncbi:cbb3-type cytochrome c oxidase subunit I [Verrucomicrobiaceae bacterium N1E253]|uniref:Cbb3-type cytochrome c oxidase subunit I n=1 Tax=Oceaniferula marina TaxID=2748318 RepID=A0A851GBV3_9BACT|nr:cbb3-type cytochrome c oxidase subunit I [Oceaniferula marina]NWK55218.1 cbb3-type cytochrome c oxidase subunit I [Oceaniferula marina]
MSTQSHESTVEDTQLRSEIDRSLRHPVMFFFTSGAAWLAVALFLAIVSMAKLYAPGFLGECSGLQYGRVFPAHLNVLVYGWGAQAGFGVLIWLMARLSRQPSKNAGTILVAGHIWNFAVAVGTIGILCGHGTGKHWMQFPTFVWPVLLGAYAAIAIWVVISFRIRRGDSTYISQWYLLGATIWFPWIYLTANLYVNVFDVQPLMAAAINAWFRFALIFLFFTPIAIASIYYIVAKITARPIYNSTYSMAGFWALAVIAPWAGMQALMGAPIPVFVQYAGAAATILIAVPLLLSGVNILKTTSGQTEAIANSPSLRFSIAATVGMLILALMSVILAHPAALKFTQFTIAGYGYELLALYGFFSMAMFGAIYFIVPRITRREWLSARMIRTHFWFSIYGILFVVIFCALLGGFQQGAAQENHVHPWRQAVEAVSPFAIGMTVAWCFILISNMFFFLHLTLMWLRLGRRSAHPTLLRRESASA